MRQTKCKYFCINLSFYFGVTVNVENTVGDGE